jgi:FMN phosphatase YigB (HAD superfamily)
MPSCAAGGAGEYGGLGLVVPPARGLGEQVHRAGRAEIQARHPGHDGVAGDADRIAALKPGPVNSGQVPWAFGGGCGYGHGMVCTGAVLIDIDGVLTVSWKPLEAAVAALRRLREAGLPLAMVTNTISRTRASIAAALSGAGLWGHCR